MTGAVPGEIEQGIYLWELKGEISLVSGTTGGSYLGHRTNSGTVTNSNVTIEARSFDLVVGDSTSDTFDVTATIGDMLQNYLLAGDVTLHATGVDGLLMNSSGDMTF